VTGKKLSGPEIVTASEKGDADANAALDRLEDRTARSLSSVVHVLDPDAIVIGGGLSKLSRLYRNLPSLLSQYTFGGPVETPICRLFMAMRAAYAEPRGCGQPPHFRSRYEGAPSWRAFD